MVFAVIYFVFRKIIGVAYNRTLGITQWLFWKLGVCAVFLPQILIANQGLPRRYTDYQEKMNFWDNWSEIGSWSIMIALILFVIIVIEGIYRRLQQGRLLEDMPH